MITTLTLLVLAAIASLSAFAGTPKPDAPPYKAESSAYVRAGKEHWTYVTQNRSFRFVDVLKGDGGGYTSLLLLESYHNERNIGLEGVQGTATITAWTINSPKSRGLRWIIRAGGNTGTVTENRLYRLSEWGCCDIPTTYYYYSLLSGQRLYVSNSDVIEVEGDGEGPQADRLIAFGYLDPHAYQKPPRLQYGTDSAVRQSFSVMSKREYYDEPGVFVEASGGQRKKTLDLRGQELTFTIVLRYRDGVELRIPVERDAIRPEKALMPDGYSLRAEK